MQSKVNNGVQFGLALNLSNNVAKISGVNNATYLQDVFPKIVNLKKLGDDGSMDYDLIRYLPEMAKISRQCKIYNAHSQSVYAAPGWSHLRTFEFSMLLTANTTAHFNNMHLCIPMQIKKKTNVVTDIDDDLN